MAIKRKDSNNNWIIDQNAIETSILDIEGHFESNNVEGALRELAEGQINNEEIASLTARMNTAEEDIAWLKENGGGGGGGGTAVPTITSTFSDTNIEKGQDVTIPIFFSSPNMGNGTAYILVNNVQVDSVGVLQGNNDIKIKAEYLALETINLVGIYVKDRAGIVSNQLSWTIISGGIELSTTFDYEADHGVTETIRMPYNISTGITSGEIILYLSIDGEVTQHISRIGYNYLDIIASDLGLGVHKVSMYATVGSYTSNVIAFNLAIVSTSELYLSSTFINGKIFDYGVPIQINYRLSKETTEEFMVHLKIDGVISKTQKLTVGNYYWTIQSLPIGQHTVTIQAVSLDYTEDKSLTLELEVVQGAYTPVAEYDLGLILDLNAVGKSNDDENVATWVDASGNGHNGQLVNFNFGTNGFIDDELICDNDAYVVIPWSPWENNAINGSTIDLIYTPINSGIEDSRVIDYTKIIDDLSTDEIKPFKGVFADVLMAIGSSASSGSNAGRVNLDDENGEIHLVWVLDRTNKFMKTYVNGVLSRIMYLSDSGSGINKFYEDFSHDEYIYLNSTKGQNCGTNNIKRLRVYDHALTSDQVLQNYLANITDLEKQKEVYDFNYNNNTLPKMYLTGDVTNMTDKQSVPMKIEYVSTNEEKFGMSFNTGIQNNPVLIQGTSSLQYVRHNYTIYLKDEYGADMLYNPYGDKGVPENVFCLKADYVESSHANNTGVAKFINDCLYDTKTPPQLENSSCRTTINGFPIEVYVNGEYLGVYNFNYDRYSYRPYGYDYVKYPNMLSYEINSNSNVSAGAFYRYGDNAESSANITELEYYKRDFNLIYGNRTTDSDTYSEVKELVEWVSVAEQDLFRETIGEHFNKEYLFRYYLMVLFIGAVDSLGKNLKINTWDGKIWYPTFYDLDTVLGIDNSGYLTIGSDVEIEAGSYNTSNSNLWTKVWNYFNAELKQEWAKMRQDRFTLDNLMSYIYGEQISKIPAKLYNDDAQVKYLDFGSLYTYCCHGSKEHQIRRWLRERIAYVDSMMGYFTSQEDQVTIRMNKTGYVSFDITPYIPLYLSVKWSNATDGTQTIKVGRGETATFYYNSTTATDQEILIPYAKHIKRLDNLSNLNPSTCILSNAVKLTNVEIHSSELYNINVTNNKFLRRLDLQDCTALGTVTATGSSLNLSNCKYLQYCNVYNTNLTEVQLNTKGGSLTEIYYPKTIQSIQLIKQRLLETVGLPLGMPEESTVPSCVCTSLYTVDIQDCPKIKKLNVSDDKDIQESFIAMAYCNNLTLRNSLNLSTLSIDNFYKLAKLTLENMYLLENVNLNNLLLKGNTPTLTYLGFSNCPLLENISFNCTSDEYEITFKNNAVLNFGNLYNLKSITSNCTWKGVKTLILPTKFETLDLTSTYGEDFCSDLINIWSSTVCNVNTNGATPTATHNDTSYSGIDFSDMNLKNINMETLIRIQRAINFNIAPTTINPNFNKNRDGNEYSYFQPSGSIDLSNYEGNFIGFFKGVNIDTLEVICNKSLNQTDFSYCFYEAVINDESSITDFLFRIVSATNLNYCFYKTSVSNISTILNNIVIGNNATMSHTFAECYNLTSLNGITIPNRVVDISNLFENCPITSINNLTINVNGSVKGLFNGCNRLIEITNLNMPNVTDMSELFKGCINLTSIVGFDIPESCANLSGIFYDCYRLNERPITVIPDLVKDISYMFYNCTDLNDISGMTFGSGIENYTDFLTNSNVEYANDLIVKTIKFKFTGNTTIKQCKNYKPASSTTDFNECFKDCTNLEEFTFHPDTTFLYAIHMTSMFENCSNLKYDILLPAETMSVTYMYRNCTKMTHIHSNWYNTYTYTITHEDCYSGCIGVMYIDDKYVLFYETDVGTMYIPKDWGGMGLTEDTLTVLKINTSLGDNSLTVTIREGNIKQQGIQPTIIDWGDGTIDERNRDSKDPSHTYANHGVYTIKFDSSILQKIENTPSLNGNIKQKVTDVLKVGRKARGYNGLVDVTSLDSAFYNYENLKYVNLEGINKDLVYSADSLFTNISKSTSLEIVIGETPIKISNATNMFGGCTNIPSIDLSGFDFSYCTTLQRAFYNCSSLLSIDLSGHNFMEVTSMRETFYNCKMLTEIIGIDKIYTPKLTNIGICFYSCSSLTSLDLSGLKPDNAFSLNDRNIAPYNESRLFGNCTSLKYLNVSNFKFKDYARQQFSYCTNLEELVMNNCDFTNVTTFESYFSGVTASKIYLKNIKLPTSAVSCNSMFLDCSNLEILDITIQDNSSLVLNNTYRMFYGCQNLTSLDVSYFNTSNCTSFQSIFERCKKLTSIDISNFDSSKVTEMISMFKYCTSLQEIIGLETLSAPKLTDMNYMFSGCSSLTRIDLSNMKPNDYVTVNGYSNAGHNDLMTFYNCTNLEYLDLSNFKIKGFLFRTFYYLSNLKTIKLNNVALGDIGNNRVDNTFPTSLTTIELNNFNIGSSLTNLSSMFYGCQNLTSLDVSSFNTSNCKTFQSMFESCENLTSIDISNFDLSKATNLISMFKYCTSLQEIIGLETLSAPNLTDMRFMFCGCSSLTRVDLSNIRPNDYVKTNDTQYNNTGHTFYKCDSLEYIDLSNFKIGGVTNMLFAYLPNLKTLKVNNASTNSTNLGNMFNTSATTVELNNLDASSATDAGSMFNGCKAISLDVSTLNIPSVISADWMFSKCTNLTSIDLDLDLSNITQLRYMFNSCTSLKSVDLSKFKFNKNILTSIDNMFNGCTSLTELDLSPLANENYTKIMDMFINCSSLIKLNLSNWSYVSTSDLNNIQYFLRNADSIRELICYNCPSEFITNICIPMSNVTPTDLRIMRNDVYVGVGGNKFIEIPSSENYVRATVSMVRATILKLIEKLDVVESGTLSLGSTNIGRLTEEDLLLATSKGWVVI